MATYYVDPVNGSDSNNGLGPDASHASNKPWRTIAKALGSSGISSGDTVYLAPGVYREAFNIFMTSPVAETKVLGDPTNAQGFKTSGGVRVAPGVVRWTAHTTNDKTASFGFCLSINGRDFLTFRNISFHGGGNCVLGVGTTSTNITFEDCYFENMGVGVAVDVTAGANTALNWTIRRCIFFSRVWCINVGITTSTTGSDWDVNVLIEDCLLVCPEFAAIEVQPSGANAVEGNGVRVRNCTIFGEAGVRTTGTRLSLTYPTTVKNCLIMANSNALAAGESGALTEDYNVLHGNPIRSNVTAGPNSKDNSYSPMLELGQGFMWGLPFLRRPPFEPMAGSPLLAFGDDGSAPSVDLLNRPRPAGGASALKAVGALERGNTFATETSVIRNGTTPISITGPGYAEFLVPVHSGHATTISVYVRRDSTYAGANPKLQLDANAAIGVSAETVTDAGGANAWNQLTLAAFTPTANGLVRVRVLSGDTNGGGRCYADDFAVA